MTAGGPNRYPRGPSVPSAEGDLRLRPRLTLTLLAVPLLLAAPARAFLDIEDRGPRLDAGAFSFRITNIGVLGNAFYDRGLSNDPSLEFPRGSGREALAHAELWVGARREDGTLGVSGGPLLEWRPTLAADDRVRVIEAGAPGTRATVDDDGDGRIDEESANGRDDDGDGEVDEDVFLPSQQMAEAVFRDDQREAIGYVGPQGETHRPLGLEVRQQVFAYNAPGYERIAGVHWFITNTTNERLHDVLVGVHADLDSRLVSAAGGQNDDAVFEFADSVTFYEGQSVISGGWNKQCYRTLKGRSVGLRDGSRSDLPMVGLVALSHTTDPLGLIYNFATEGSRAAYEARRAPAKDTTFRYTVFATGVAPRQGGPPTLDVDRYDALRGRFPASNTTQLRDYSVLLSCGPFATLGPGETVEMAVAFVLGESPDSLSAAATNARLLWYGIFQNRQPDTSPLGSHTGGFTGINGHELCYSPPPGITFRWDPNCNKKYIEDPAYDGISGFPPAGDPEVLYRSDLPCVWTDWDCDNCTGRDGRETQVHWTTGTAAPPQPSVRVTAGERQVSVAWDDYPEIVIGAGIIPGGTWRFGGYRLYRLSDWTREALFPPIPQWQQLAAFGPDTLFGAVPLAEITDPTVAYDYVLYERRHHPVGRYRYVDREVLDGFDYHYAVTTLAVRDTVQGGVPRRETLESPFRAVFSDVVRPRAEARDDARQVRVVPNPYRGGAEWDRRPVPGDVFARHIDFVGLPRARCTIKVWTVAGDFVAQIDHDGRSGNGQASWDLISRNGQDVVSGLYLFTVDSALGQSTGRFIVIR